MIIQDIPASRAREFIRAWHYAGSASGGIAYHGWEEDGILLGVSIYNTGNRATLEGVFGPEYAHHVVHHHRLALHPSVPHGTTSQFLAASLRKLKADRPWLWAVVTYAESDQGHVGTIYQAVNGVYTGMVTKGNLYFRKPDGTIGTMQGLSHVGTWPERRAYAASLGWTEMRSGGKHRYVLLLGKRREIRWPVLPYPKKEF